LERRIADTGQKLEREHDPLRRLELFQRRIAFQDELADLPDEEAYEQLEREFVALLPAYSAEHGISRQAWREAGVPARVLRAAGIP